MEYTVLDFKGGYARRRGKLGDVSSINHDYVNGILHITQRPFCWHLGLGCVELIEFGSFNPANKNYTPGGKVVKIV